MNVRHWHVFAVTAAVSGAMAAALSEGQHDGWMTYFIAMSLASFLAAVVTGALS